MERMFSGAHDVQKNRLGQIFIDRDGHTFLAVVNYLRNDMATFPGFDTESERQLFKKELEFWGINPGN